MCVIPQVFPQDRNCSLFMKPNKTKILWIFEKREQSTDSTMGNTGKETQFKAVIGSVKRKYGSSVSARTANSQKTQIYLRMILHNISRAAARLFHLSSTIH